MSHAEKDERRHTRITAKKQYKKHRRTLAVDSPEPDTTGKGYSGPRKRTSRLKLLDFQKTYLSKQRVFARTFRYRLYNFVRTYVLRTAYSVARFKLLSR